MVGVTDQILGVSDNMVGVTDKMVGVTDQFFGVCVLIMFNCPFVSTTFQSTAIQPAFKIQNTSVQSKP